MGSFQRLSGPIPAEAVAVASQLAMGRQVSQCDFSRFGSGLTNYQREIMKCHGLQQVGRRFVCARRGYEHHFGKQRTKNLNKGVRTSPERAHKTKSRLGFWLTPLSSPLAKSLKSQTGELELWSTVLTSLRCGSNLSHQGTAGFSLWFHLPGQAILGIPYF